MDPPPLPFPSSSPAMVPAPKSNGGKWVLVGCGGCLGLIVLGVLFWAAIFFVTVNVIQKTDVYADALKRAQNSAEIQAALGTPITTSGWTFSGSVNYINGAGSANFTVPVTGPKGEGILSVKADKPSAAEAWQYSTLEVKFPDGQTVDLRGPP